MGDFYTKNILRDGFLCSDDKGNFVNVKFVAKFYKPMH